MSPFDKTTDDTRSKSNPSRLDQAVTALLAEVVPPGPPPALKDRLAESWERAPQASPRKQIRSRLLSVVMAASMLLAGVVVWQLISSHSGIALADVYQELKRAQSVQFRIIHYTHVTGGQKGTSVWRRTSTEECSFALLKGL